MIDHKLVAIHHGHLAVDRNARLLAGGVGEGAAHHGVGPVDHGAVGGIED
jgi:hypothetical protein